MKLRTTTPASIPLVARLTLVAVSILVVVAIPIQMTQKVFADQYDDKINALQQDISRYQSEGARLNTEAATLQSALAQLANQKAAIQTEIDISQVKYDQLVTQIAETEQKIKSNQDALGKIIADLYVDDKITPIEMLASSNNISDYLDKQEYRSSIRDQLANTISQIKTLKTQLVKQQADVKVILDRQLAQKADLVATQTKQQDLLNQTQGQEATYQQLVTVSKEKIAQAAAQQAAAVRSYGSGGNSNLGVGGGGGYIGPAPLGPFGYLHPSGNTSCPAGGYPYCGGLDSYSDPYQLFNRECVSYAAWAADVKYNKKVSGFMGMGMAYEFANTAKLYMNATVDNNPEVGAVAILPPLAGFAEVGHAMIVDSIIDNDWVHVSQYNFGSTGQYSEMDIRAGGVVYVHFQNR